MNRRKKINQILKARAEKRKPKVDNPNKPKYISKADRAKIEAAQLQASVGDQDNS